MLATTALLLTMDLSGTGGARPQGSEESARPDRRP